MSDENPYKPPPTVEAVRPEPPKKLVGKPLTEEEMKVVGATRDFVREFVPEFFPRIQEFYEQGLIEGWRCVSARLLTDEEKARAKNGERIL